jgi:hypothetical protein
MACWVIFSIEVRSRRAVTIMTSATASHTNNPSGSTVSAVTFPTSILQGVSPSSRHVATRSAVSAAATGQRHPAAAQAAVAVSSLFMVSVHSCCTNLYVVNACRTCARHRSMSEPEPGPGLELGLGLGQSVMKRALPWLLGGGNLYNLPPGWVRPRPRVWGRECPCGGILVYTSPPPPFFAHHATPRPGVNVGANVFARPRHCRGA